MAQFRRFTREATKLELRIDDRVVKVEGSTGVVVNLDAIAFVEQIEGDGTTMSRIVFTACDGNGDARTLIVTEDLSAFVEWRS